MKILRTVLDDCYKKFNSRGEIEPDPLQFLYDYKSVQDREIAGLVASCLAYGRVQQICTSVSTVLSRFEKPSKFLKDKSRDDLLNLFADFKHRFSTGKDIANLLYCVRKIREEYGSLEKCFLKGYQNTDENIIPALEKFVDEFTKINGDRIYYLLPSPADGSACKRLNLYIKWMVRIDNVDPGGWKHIPASKLIMPVDVHIHRICYKLGFTNRKAGDLNTALDITDSFRQISPDDPTKYDFALTRLGMRNSDKLVELYRRCGVKDMEIDVS